MDFAVGEELTARLRSLGQAQGATLFMVLLAAFKVLLYRYTGERDLRIGVPTANRGRVETEGLVGLFVNTQVLRTRVDGRQRFTEVLKQVREGALGAQAHQDLPFEQLVEALSPERSLSHNPLFQVMYNHQRRAMGALGRLRELQIETFERESRSTQFDLTLDTQEDDHGALIGALGYATDLFDATTIERMSERFQRVLEEIVKNPDQRVGDIGLLTEHEAAQVAAWMRIERRYEREIPAQEWIRRRAEERPEACAVVCGEQRLSYGELEQRANRVAHELVKRGVGPEKLVGISVSRSVEMVVGMLGIWKAGGAYVPLDPVYPSERLAYMMADAAVEVVVTDARARAALAVPAGVATLCLEELSAEAKSSSPVAVPVCSEHLAYMIYTSGSTGRPKGVEVTHGSLSMHCQAVADVYGVIAEDRAMHFASLSFDAAVEQWVVPLIRGARLVIMDAAQWSAERAYEELIRYEITWLDVIPSYLAEVARWANAHGRLLPLRSCTVGERR